jgi:hypothetical protein
MGKKIGDFNFVTAWNPRRKVSVLVEKKIENNIYNQLLLRSGISLPERRKIANDIRLNYSKSVRLIKVNKLYEIFVCLHPDRRDYK